MVNLLRKMQQTRTTPPQPTGKSSSQRRFPNKSSSSDHTPPKPPGPRELSTLKHQLEQAKAKIHELEEKVPPPLFEECKHNSMMDKAAAGKSMDSWKMSSTLHHMDIEEVSRCIARMLSENRDKDPHPFISQLLVPFEETQLTLGSQENIYNFLRNAVIRLDLDKEVTLTALLYMQRVLEKARAPITNSNWKKLLFTALVVAAKVWDDESYRNSEVIEHIKLTSAAELCHLETTFLSLIDYDLYISNREFAEVYFKVKTYVHKDDPSRNLRQLDVATVLRLQKNAKEAQDTAKAAMLKSM